MFTGLISERGRLLGVQATAALVRLNISAPGILASGLKTGDSVAVNGICLTVVALDPGVQAFAVEAVPETAARSTLSAWRSGEQVNLERALVLGDRLDGHLVAGHVDGVAVVQAVVSEGASRRIRLSAPLELMKYIAAKGSVALDGVSLTVADLLLPDGFSVAVIPHTQALTGADAWTPGRKVNLEVDLIARYLERLQTPASGEGVSWDDLRSAGF